jgi:hypothetical protein
MTDALEKNRQDCASYSIPEELLRFFSEQKGVPPRMLKKGYFGMDKRGCCDMINYFRKVTFPLIRFYLETPPFSVEDLLNYNEYAIRDFAVHDEDLRFHKWLIENKFTIPPALVGGLLGQHLLLVRFFWN